MSIHDKYAEQVIAARDHDLAEAHRRIGRLEGLVRDMWAGILREYPQGGFPDMGLMEKRILDLGLEVDA